MAHRIFLNYRRIDSDAWADRLHERLGGRFGEENVFLDVDGRIPPGLDFTRFLNDQVAACEAMVVVIGPRWLEEIQRRVESGAADFVRIEIEAALARDIPVAPALVGGATMPLASALPESLRPLTLRHALSIGRGPEFAPAVERLIEGLKTAIALTKGAPEPKPLSREDRLFASPAGTVFRDPMTGGGEGPEMVVIPAGRFLMGSPEDEPDRHGSEGPQHEVTIAQPFALGRYAVTFDEYDAFCAATGTNRPGDQGWGRGRRPVIDVSWLEAEGYCRWLSEQTGAEYRLPSEAEWEYACRAGTATPFWQGRELTSDQANYGGRRGKTEPVDAFRANPWGLHQTHGNVWEWCADLWHGDYAGAPADGSAWLQANAGSAASRVIRGGSWSVAARYARSAYRYRRGPTHRSVSLGFRCARGRVEPGR